MPYIHRVGNPIDQCISTPSADFWPIGSEGATNPYLKYPTTSSPNEEMGRIINDASDTIQLKTSSGRIIAVDYRLIPLQISIRIMLLAMTLK